MRSRAAFAPEPPSFARPMHLRRGALLRGAFLLLFVLPVSPVAAQPAAVAAVDSARLLTDLRVLAADSMEGRRPGTEGSERARRYLLQRMREIGLEPLGGSDRKSTRLNSSHVKSSYAVFCLKKKRTRSGLRRRHRLHVRVDA